MRELARRRSILNADFLAEVASVYRAGGTRGRKAVAERWGRPPSSVEKWIRAARQRGLLGPAPRPGRAGERQKGQDR